MSRLHKTPSGSEPPCEEDHRPLSYLIKKVPLLFMPSLLCLCLTLLSLRGWWSPAQETLCPKIPTSEWSHCTTTRRWVRWKLNQFGRSPWVVWWRRADAWCAVSSGSQTAVVLVVFPHTAVSVVYSEVPVMGDPGAENSLCKTRTASQITPEFIINVQFAIKRFILTDFTLIRKINFP